ncbi:hypothetical protein [Methanosarcina horonobensis]|uniref:hypothetical protein n=1 Tax=Methanosarcina horonobensis TaxID=418008 RepID=UPI000AB1E61E|nr:hypothetical protein [Methanosarcina horonobensis]
MMNAFVSLPEVGQVVSKGKTRSSVIIKEGFGIDLRIVPPESYGAALQYFTGSKEHNIELRNIALREGYKLSEYGLYSKDSGQQVAGRSEEEIYRKLGLKYIAPELRENRGEIKAAAKKMPCLNLWMQKTSEEICICIQSTVKGQKALRQ